jgi:hypothetical protein
VWRRPSSHLPGAINHFAFKRSSFSANSLLHYPCNWGKVRPHKDFKTRVSTMKKLIALSALLFLPACSIFESKGEEIRFDTVLGPETEQQLKGLPSTLEGDSENARHTPTERKGAQMESEDGTEE